MKYALFLGCTIPVRALNYEISTRKVSEKLGIQLVDINDFSCCGFPVKSLDAEGSLLMAARNLAIAEEKNLDVCTLCNACTEVLTEANNELKKDEKLRERINKKLSSIGRKYEGKIQVKHFARILYEDVGLSKIKEKIKVNLSKFSFAAHYGCHYVKPSGIYDKFDDPENPKTLDELIEVTGAKSVSYEGKNLCCGGGVLGIQENTALKITKLKFDYLKDVSQNGMVLICPFCDIMYEGSQKKIERESQVKYNIPVLYYPQLLGLALGIPPEELGFKLNRIKPKQLLAELG